MKKPFSQFLKYYLKGKFHDLFLVIQYKDDCVYKTQQLGMVVFDRSFPPYRNHKDIIEASISRAIIEQM